MTNTREQAGTETTREPDFIIVYGTLRKGQGANRMMDGCEFIGETRIAGVMYSLGGFPGIKLKDSAEDENRFSRRFVGEVYELPKDQDERVSIINRLDRYEGAPGHYYRRIIDLPYDENACTDEAHGGKIWGKAYIYEYGYDVSDRRRIESGDWLNQK